MSSDRNSSLSRRGLLAAAVVGLAGASLVAGAQDAPAPAPLAPTPAYKVDAIYIVHHPGIPAESVAKARYKSIYLGNQTSWGKGLSIVPFQRQPGSTVADRFLAEALGYDAMGFAQHWQGIELSGQAMAPRVIGNIAEVLNAVATTPGAICYVMGGELTETPNGVVVLPLPAGKN